MKWLERIKGWFGGNLKSSNSLGVGLRSVLSSSAAGGWASDHREETVHNTGFNYIAIHAIASQVAAATVTVFADGELTDLQRSKRKSLAATAGTFSRWKSTYGAGDRTTDPLPPHHPLVQLLKRPSSMESGAHFRYRQAQQLRLTGTCLIWNVPGRSGVTCERYVIPTAMATPVAPMNELPRGGWRINPVASRYTPIIDEGYMDCPTWYRILGQIIDARQVQVIRLPHAWYLDDGQSPLSAGAKWVDAGEAVDDARYHQLKNGIDPSVVWNLPPDVSPDQDEIDRIQVKISAKYGGAQNVGKVMIAQNGTTVTPISTSPKEMCYTEGFQDFKAAVLALHQTPPVAVGLQEPGAYAAYNASMKAWRHSAIQPLCDMLAEADTEWLAPQFGEGLTIELESNAVEDAELLESQLQNDLAAGVRTRNEWRAIRGLLPLPEPLGSQIVGTPTTTSAEPVDTSETSTEIEPVDDQDEADLEDDSTFFPFLKSSVGWTRPPEEHSEDHLLQPLDQSDSISSFEEEDRDHLKDDDRAELIAEILYGLYGSDAIELLESDVDFDTKSFDPSLHPRNELGQFTSRGNHEDIEKARQTISNVLKGEGPLRTDEEIARALNLLTVPQLRALHQEHGVKIPSTLRAHLVENVRVRLNGPRNPSEPPRWPSSSAGSHDPHVHVFVQHPEKLNQIIGRSVKDHEWGQLVGAQPGARVHVYPDGYAVAVAVEHPAYFSRRRIRQDCIENTVMQVSPEHRGEGIGTKVVSEQVRKAKELGFHHIEMTAMGDGRSVEGETMNHEETGYYAWARLGFDGPIRPLLRTRGEGSENERKAVRDFKNRFPGVKRVSEMMLTKERQDWWREYGGEFEGRFLLDDDSTSLRVLNAYHAELASRGTRKSLVDLKSYSDLDEVVFHPLPDFTNVAPTDQPVSSEEPFDRSGILSREDEDILDKIWLEIGRQMGFSSSD